MPNKPYFPEKLTNGKHCISGYVSGDLLHHIDIYRFNHGKMNKSDFVNLAIKQFLENNPN